MALSFWFYHDEAYTKRASGNVIQRVYNIGPNFYILYNPSTRKFDLSSRSPSTGSTQYTWQWPTSASLQPLVPRGSSTSTAAPRPAVTQKVMYLDGVRVLSNPNSVAFPAQRPFTTPFVRRE
jgi:hypothetical protein